MFKINKKGNNASLFTATNLKALQKSLKKGLAKGFIMKSNL
jgi:hypothetical protein